ncbi:MAG: DUF934 domain-containing protein [Betaproteobacteria bacterium]|nr:DUF934 domain-containing protein [Betaproteobacteria bacterium]
MADMVINRQVVPDVWQRVSEVSLPLPTGQWIYLLSEWQELAERPQSPSGLWIETSQDPEVLVPHLEEVQLIAVHFPIFTDGRGHSLGHWLRKRAKFSGELRAVGDVFRDSVHELERCGFNAFVPRNGETAANLLCGLGIFSDAYQASVDRSEPLFRRRLINSSGI